MNPEFLSRLQFGLTISFHFIFPPISMGLGLMICLMSWKYLKTREQVWREASFFWVKVYGLVFALGIATGIVQEFEFGTNWSAYSRFVGNVFGSLLAAEGIFAFMLEGGFLGLMLFGGSRLGPRMWFWASVLVVFGAHFSAIWILMANSWMQTPAGYQLQASPWGLSSTGGTLAVMTSFLDVMFTKSFPQRLFHTWVASWMIGSALVMSVSAWYLLKKRHTEFAKKNLTLAIRWFTILALLQVFVVGAAMAVEVTDNQVPKLAAMEGSWTPQSCAPLYLVGWVNESAQTTTGIKIPCLLSFLSYQDFQAVVPGLNGSGFTSSVWPPVNLEFQVYHVMIDLGFLFPMIGVLAWLYWRRRRDTGTMPKIVLWACVVTVFLTEIATIAGWWTAEIGRQPWIVWNVLRTSDAVSPTLETTQVFLSLVMFALLYLLLGILFIVLLDRKIKKGPEPVADVPEGDLPDTLREMFRREPRAHTEEVRSGVLE
jgi:cytochrome d ubiquinol oxidase subunit I